MSRLYRSIGALLLAVVVGAGASAGPAFGDTPAAAEPTTTTESAEPTTTRPVETEPTQTEPTETEPGEPTPVGPAVPEGSPAPDEPADPAAAEPGEGVVDLTISVTFDKPSFVGDEYIRARASVTNSGTATATDVQVVSAAPVDSNYWSGFGYGVSIEPGRTAEGTFGARLNARLDLLTLEVTTRSAESPDANPADNTVTVSVPITYVLGTYRGTVYADRNGSAEKDAGEEFAGLAVTASGMHVSQGSYTTVTDPAGRFAFQDLPRGEYWLSFADSDWVFPWGYRTVDGEDDPDVLIRAARPVDPVLTASAAFDRQSYRVGDTARLTLTLANSGPTPIPGVTAECWTEGARTPDLGELAPGGPGATVPANAGRAFDLRLPIDSRIADQGHVQVSCTFGAPPRGNGNVVASAIARVPGVIAAKVSGQVTLPGRLYPGPCGCPLPGEPVPDLKVYLKDQVTGAVLARATTDAEGVFEFHDVQVGLHDFGVVGPWKIVRGGPAFTVRLDEADPRHHLVYVEPGPDQPDPDVAQPGGPPAPGAGAGPGQQPAAGHLASTGVDVTWLALGGLLTLLAGVGLTFRTRRKEF